MTKLRKNLGSAMLVGMVALASAPASAATVTWTPQPAPTVTGNSVRLSAILSDAADLGAILLFGGVSTVKLEATWDASALDYVDFEAGSGFTGSPNVFTNPQPGSLIATIRADGLPPPATDDPFELLVLELMVRNDASPGPVPIPYTLTIDEPPLGVAFTSPEIAITAVVPVPAALPLLTVGLLTLGFLGLRSRPRWA